MKKLAAILILISTLLAASPSYAVYGPVPAYDPALMMGGGVSGGPSLLPFLTAVTVGFAVVYLDANGVPFPLCNVNGLKCYQEYPDPIHKDGV